MREPPRELPERGKNAGLFRWLNALLRYVIETRPIAGPGMTFVETPRGVAHTSEGGETKTTPTGEATWL